MTDWEICPGCSLLVRLTRLGTGICNGCGLLRLNEMVCAVMDYPTHTWIPLSAAGENDVARA